MARKYSGSTGNVNYTLEVSSTTKCKLTINKRLHSKYELSFDSLADFMDFAMELHSLGEQWIAEEEYDSGIREFYME